MTIDLSAYQGLIFDMDGTLIDTMPANLPAREKTANQYDFPFDTDSIYSLSDQPSAKMAMEMIERYQLDLDPYEIAKTKMNYYLNLQEHGDMIECTYQILLENRDKKRTAIRTGSQRASALQLLESKGVVSLFDTIVTSSDVTN